MHRASTRFKAERSVKASAIKKRKKRPHPSPRALIHPNMSTSDPRSCSHAVGGPTSWAPPCPRPAHMCTYSGLTGLSASLPRTSEHPSGSKPHVFTPDQPTMCSHRPSKRASGCCPALTACCLLPAACCLLPAASICCGGGEGQVSSKLATHSPWRPNATKRYSRAAAVRTYPRRWLPRSRHMQRASRADADADADADAHAARVACPHHQRATQCICTICIRHMVHIHAGAAPESHAMPPPIPLSTLPPQRGCLLPAACCLLPAACRLLPAACRLPPAACCLLPWQRPCCTHQQSGHVRTCTWR